MDIYVRRGKGQHKNPLKSVGSRVMAIAVISKRTLAIIIKEGKEVDKGASTSLSNIGDVTSKKRRSQS
jgi:hypothetical protein